MSNLIGIGLYTPAEASRLLAIPASKISRWLRGHHTNNHEYSALWSPEVDIGDGHIYLGFRDLMETRIADKFIRCGVSAQRVRSAILLAREIIKEDRPLSTNQFRTDGRSIFLRIVDTDDHGEERERLLNLFRSQYEFQQVIEPLLKTIEFDARGRPFLWWPNGRRGNIVVDPARAFGRPIDVVSSVPTAILAAAGRHQGIPLAAKSYDVPPASIKRAIKFEEGMERRAAA